MAAMADGYQRDGYVADPRDQQVRSSFYS